MILFQENAFKNAINKHICSGLSALHAMFLFTNHLNGL